jgi:hypothetical protein
LIALWTVLHYVFPALGYQSHFVWGFVTSLIGIQIHSFTKIKKTGVSAVTAIGIVVAIYISVTAVSAISIGHSYFLIEIMTLDLSERR